MGMIRFVNFGFNQIFKKKNCYKRRQGVVLCFHMPRLFLSFYLIPVIANIQINKRKKKKKKAPTPDNSLLQ